MRRRSVRDADHVREQLAGEVLRALRGPLFAVAEERVDHFAVEIAARRWARRIDKAAVHDTAAEVGELGNAASIATDHEGDEVRWRVRDGAIEYEEGAGTGLGRRREQG